MTQAHELAQRSCQKVRLPMWLQAAERQTLVRIVHALAGTVDRIVGRKGNRHVRQRVDSRRPPDE